MTAISKELKAKDLKYRLGDILKKNNWSQPQLAAYLKVSYKTVWNWCNLDQDDATSIPGDALVRISFLFKVRVEDIHNKKHFKALAKAV